MIRVRFRPQARLEIREARGWYNGQVAGGYGLVAALAGGGSQFSDTYPVLVNVAVASVNTGAYLLFASIILIPFRRQSLRRRWCVALTVAGTYLTLLLLLIPSPWWI